MKVQGNLGPTDARLGKRRLDVPAAQARVEGTVIPVSSIPYSAARRRASRSALSPDPVHGDTTRGKHRYRTGGGETFQQAGRSRYCTEFACMFCAEAPVSGWRGSAKRPYRSPVVQAHPLLAENPMKVGCGVVMTPDRTAMSDCVPTDVYEVHHGNGCIVRKQGKSYESRGLGLIALTLRRCLSPSCAVRYGQTDGVNPAPSPLE